MVCRIFARHASGLWTSGSGSASTSDSSGSSGSSSMKRLCSACEQLLPMVTAALRSNAARSSGNLTGCIAARLCSCLVPCFRAYAPVFAAAMPLYCCVLCIHQHHALHAWHSAIPFVVQGVLMGHMVVQCPQELCAHCQHQQVRC